jgi:hypothetical protein
MALAKVKHEHAGDGSSELKISPGLALFRYHRWTARQRARMLPDLANLPDNGTGWFWRKWDREYMHSNWDRQLMDYRNELREIWARPLSARPDALTIADVTLLRWLGETRNRETWLYRSGCVIQNYRILPLALAIGVSELAPRMAICKNPDCPSPYFLKSRKTQQFCDRTACLAYGQRAQKLEWWNKHGENWRANRKPRKGKET